MKKILITYFSPSGTTRSMADYIGEGVRIGGQEATVLDILDLDPIKDLENYQGIIVGCPTYYSDIPGPVKSFLDAANKQQLQGKLGGAFGSVTHDGNAPEMVLDALVNTFGMRMFELGALTLKEYMFNPVGRDEAQEGEYIAGEVYHEGAEGIKACQDYGKVFAKDLAGES